MITLDRDELVFRFPEVHEDAVAAVNFQRTLRLPDDGRTYPLPPGIGRVPLRHVDDFANRVPEAWRARGGVFLPMHQAEALWVAFHAPNDYPVALKIAAGKINAVTGEDWKGAGIGSLNRDPQDYIVLPEQPWLDGFCVETGKIRQFVAMPLGEGYTVEEQITGDAEYGGVQIVAVPMKARHWEELRAKTGMRRRSMGPELMMASAVPAPGMGLGMGGEMTQDIYDDPHGLDAWDLRHARRCFVSLANSVAWAGITGEAPPLAPPTAQDYARAGLPWFDWYGGDAKALEGAGIFKNVKTVAEVGAAKGKPLAGNDSVVPGPVHTLSVKPGTVVREPENAP